MSTYRPHLARKKLRYDWAREHGCTATMATHLSGDIERFRAFVTGLGVDPDSLGPFARNMGPGGVTRLQARKGAA